MVFPSILLHAGDNLHISKKRKKTSAGFGNSDKKRKICGKNVLFGEKKQNYYWFGKLEEMKIATKFLDGYLRKLQQD